MTGGGQGRRFGFRHLAYSPGGTLRFRLYAWGAYLLGTVG